MIDLVERLSDRAREQGAVNAVQDATGGAWTWRTWSELEIDVNRLCGALPVARGDRLSWDAPAGARRLALDLALLHLGVVGVGGGDPLSAEQMDTWATTRVDPGRLVRLRAELRPRDPAAERQGRILDLAGVDALAARVATQIGVESPGSVLVDAGPEVEQAVGWGAVYAGYAVVVGGAELLPVLQPVVWVAGAEAVAAAAPPPSRAGGFGGLLRAYGRTGSFLGGRLRKILVTGPVPAEADRYRARGVEVAPWTG